MECFYIQFVTNQPNNERTQEKYLQWLEPYEPLFVIFSNGSTCCTSAVLKYPKIRHSAGQYWIAGDVCEQRPTLLRAKSPLVLNPGPQDGEDVLEIGDRETLLEESLEEKVEKMEKQLGELKQKHYCKFIQSLNEEGEGEVSLQIKERLLHEYLTSKVNYFLLTDEEVEKLDEML